MCVCDTYHWWHWGTTGWSRDRWVDRHLPLKFQVLVVEPDPPEMLQCRHDLCFSERCTGSPLKEKNIVGGVETDRKEGKWRNMCMRTGIQERRGVKKYSKISSSEQSKKVMNNSVVFTYSWPFCLLCRPTGWEEQSFGRARSWDSPHGSYWCRQHRTEAHVPTLTNRQVK